MSTDSAHAPGTISASSTEIRDKWGWFVAVGVAFVVLGTIAFLNVFVATVASVYFIGLLMLIGGAIQIAEAFGVKSWGSFLIWLLSGILYAAAGILAFMNPLLASLELTLALAIVLVASGLMRIWIGIKERPGNNWGWIVAAGVVTLILGIIVALGWPVNSLWVLGLFLAVDLIFQGWSFIAFGLALRSRDTGAGFRAA